MNIDLVTGFLATGNTQNHKRKKKCKEKEKEMKLSENGK
jgi:hypothetical protein